jgi:hypothetical protein
MARRLILLFLAFAASLPALGCCGGRQRIWRCPDGDCGVLSGRFDACGGGCTNCDSCGEVMGRCRCGPLAALRRRLTCGEGCGEFYWDEWHSDPPAPCDPCDNYGNFVGPRCCPLPWRRRVANLLLGRRCCTMNCDGYCQDACGAAGCTSAATPVWGESEMNYVVPGKGSPHVLPPGKQWPPSPPPETPPPRTNGNGRRAPMPPGAPRTPADDRPMLEGPEARRSQTPGRTTSTPIGSGLRR